MSRIAKNPILIPENIEVSMQDACVIVKGKNGAMKIDIDPLIDVRINDGFINIVYDRSNRQQNVIAGTARANIANMIVGVSLGYERKLSMVGVGYRAQVKENTLNLSLGFSHPIEFAIPLGVKIETPTQTDIIIKGFDKQQVGQVAANIRAYRSPEPYKGKGVRYSDEQIVKKEAKKK
jgi:large subunit ribosomal protein L6